MRELQSAKLRRKDLEKLLKISLTNIGKFSLDESVAGSRNCEQMIGVSQVPMGVSGPLRVNGHNFYIPISTTEGALIASVNRGCKAVTLCGGTKIMIEKIGATRGPVFEVKNLEEGEKLEGFLKNHFKDLKEIASKTSKHIKLKETKGQIAGRYYFARFTFDTGRAMGMNMATVATGAIAEFIEKKTGIKCLSLSGNYCVDKKSSWINFIDGRGYKVWAEVVLREKIIKEILKTSAQKIYEVWLAKCMVGSAISGSMGFNAQFANVVAGILLATGQDLGHIVEGSMGVTTAEVAGKDLYMSVYLPDLMIGTVGGGTGLATQKEALSIIGEKHFPEVIGGAILAGEISLLASLSEGSLVRAHETLARGKTK